MSIGDRRARFRELHDREQLFVMPNPWDIGSARLLASCGFEALATTSAGLAWSLGKHDQEVTREGLVAHVGSSRMPARPASRSRTGARPPAASTPWRSRRSASRQPRVPPTICHGRWC